MSIFVIGALINGILFKEIFDFYTSHRMADIIPLIEVLVKRLLKNEFVYAFVTKEELGAKHELHPTYMPLQWMPYLISYILKIHHQWIAYLIFLTGVLIYLLKLVKITKNLIELIVKSVLPFAVLFIIGIVYHRGMYGMTVELMIIGYYFILTISIFSKSNFFRALGLILCLLSRYTCIIWVPLYILLIFFNEKKKNAVYISAMVLAGILLIYVIPFMSNDWSIFTKSHQAYKSAAIAVWNASSTISDYENHTFFRGFGFACFFYEFAPGNLTDKVLLLKNAQVIFAVLSIIIAGLFYIKVRTAINYRLYALLSLEFYLVVFYVFLEIPYGYLTSLSVFFTIPLLGFIKYSQSPSNNGKIQSYQSVGS